MLFFRNSTFKGLKTGGSISDKRNGIRTTWLDQEGSGARGQVETEAVSGNQTIHL